MNDDTRKCLFRLGMDDKILSYFTTTGPFESRVTGMTHIMADFSDGPDVNVHTSSYFSPDEMKHLKDRLRDESKIYHMRGKQAGEDLMMFLSNAGRFEQYVRSRWWWKTAWWIRRIFRKAFALLRFWRYTWVVKFFRPKHHGDCY